MDDRRLVKLSRYLSTHLRHRPERIGLVLDAAGWVDVDALLDALGRHGVPLTREELDEVVERNDKRRYAFDETGTRIRATQGHSVAVDLGYAPTTPPDVLFHGTVAAALPSIMAQGLTPQGRHDVHLSPDVPTARRVGARRGRPVVLAVDAAAMHAAGHAFRVSDNGVWLTDHVPARYLARTEGCAPLWQGDPHDDGREPHGSEEDQRGR